MTLLLWSDQFKTDIRAVDEDHRLLFEIFSDSPADEIVFGEIQL